VSELTISLIAFACIFTGTMLGMIVRNILPEHHLSDESKDAVKMGGRYDCYNGCSCSRLANRLGQG
jgi:hypothetical protein